MSEHVLTDEDASKNLDFLVALREKYGDPEFETADSKMKVEFVKKRFCQFCQKDISTRTQVTFNTHTQEILHTCISQPKVEHNKFKCWMENMRKVYGIKKLPTLEIPSRSWSFSLETEANSIIEKLRGCKACVHYKTCTPYKPHKYGTDKYCTYPDRKYKIQVTVSHTCDKFEIIQSIRIAFQNFLKTLMWDKFLLSEMREVSKLWK